MNLCLLKNIAELFKEYTHINSLKRIQDNLFRLQLNQEIFYLDMQKSQSNIFISTEMYTGKTYQAPFDILLQKLAKKARLLDCFCDGNNRILILHCRQHHLYKDFEFFIHFEFTGKHTNVILVDHENIILEALRHLNSDKTSREIKVNQPLIPLFQKNTSEKIIFYSKEQIFYFLQENYHKINTQKLLQYKQKVLSKLDKKIYTYQCLLKELPQAAELENQAKKLRDEANLLLSNLHLIKPFDKYITLKDFNDQQIQIEIPKSYHLPQDCINYMFTQSKKLSKKAKNIYLEEQNLKNKIHFLQQEMRFIQKTNSLDNISILEPQKRIKEKNIKFESFFIENYKISIGKNQNENQALLEMAKANDIWLHIKNIPSSHMIIHCGKTRPPQYIIQKAGEILVELNEILRGNFEVDYTLRKFVKIKENAHVSYAKYQTLVYKKEG